MMILCMGEREYFPATEFKLDQGRNLIHAVKDEDAKYWHYQSTGDPLEPTARISLPVLNLVGDGVDVDEVLTDAIQKRYQAQLDELDAIQKRYQAQLDELKVAPEAIRERIKDGENSDYTSLQAINSAYLDVAKGQIDRAQTRATQVITAASAIGTIYTAILGLHFSSSVPLPITGIIPGIFLGIAIIFALIYLAYLKLGVRSLGGEKPSGIASFRVKEQRDMFIAWTNELVQRRLPWLHAAVITLAFGVMFLPIAFFSVDSRGAWIAFGFGVIGAILDGVIVGVLFVKDKKESLNKRGFY